MQIKYENFRHMSHSPSMKGIFMNTVQKIFFIVVVLFYLVIVFRVVVQIYISNMIANEKMKPQLWSAFEYLFNKVIYSRAHDCDVFNWWWYRVNS